MSEIADDVFQTPLTYLGFFSIIPVHAQLLHFLSCCLLPTPQIHPCAHTHTHTHARTDARTDARKRHIVTEAADSVKVKSSAECNSVLQEEHVPAS